MLTSSEVPVKLELANSGGLSLTSDTTTSNEMVDSWTGVPRSEAVTCYERNNGISSYCTAIVFFSFSYCGNQKMKLFEIQTFMGFP